jgi:hypothetical protein
MTALLRDNLVRVRTTEEFAYEVRILAAMKLVLNFVEQDHGELINVHLLEYLHHGAIGTRPYRGSEKLRVDG